MKILFYIILLYLSQFILSDDEDENMNYICDNIYLGNCLAAIDEEYLKSYNITTVVNCAFELPSEYNFTKFLELKLVDSNDTSLIPKLEVAYKFIKLNSKNNVLIHCGSGITRSASLFIFYLMKEKGWDYDECYNYVKERRPIINPGEGYETRLKEYYEKNIKDKKN